MPGTARRNQWAVGATPLATPLIAKELQASFRQAIHDARKMRHASLTLEHLMLALSHEPKTEKILVASGANVKRLRQELEKVLAERVERLPEGVSGEPQQTIGIERVLQRAAIHALSAEKKIIDGGDVLVAMLREHESDAVLLLRQEGLTRARLVEQLSPGDAEGDGNSRAATQMSFALDVWKALVRYRSERELVLEREVSTAEAVDELVRKALGLEPPSPPTSDPGE